MAETTGACGSWIYSPAGLLVQGLVFTQRAHREFLPTSGVLLDIE